MTGGVSPAAVYLEHEYESNLKKMTTAASFSREPSRQKLLHAYIQSRQNDTPVRHVTYQSSLELIDNFPSWVDDPTIEEEVDGNVMFEWRKNSSWIVNASVCDGMLYFSALLGPYEETRGRCALHGAFPSELSRLIGEVCGKSRCRVA
jgi:hypothetical protein